MRDDRHGRGRRADIDRRRRPVDGSRASSRRRFERLAKAAVAALPPALRDVAIHLVVADVPDPDHRRPVALSRYVRGAGGDRDLLVLYRRPLEARARSPEELADLVEFAVFETVSRGRGLDHDDLGEFGWG